MSAGIIQMSARESFGLLMCSLGGVVSNIISCSGSVPQIYRHRFQNRSGTGAFVFIPLLKTYNL